MQQLLNLRFRHSKTVSSKQYQAKISKASGLFSSSIQLTSHSFVLLNLDLADKYEELKGMGVEVFSVSCDTHFVHKAWADASDSIKKIKYTMLADPLGVLAKGFGVYIEEEGMAYRGTFLVNPEGKIKLAEMQDNSIGRNADELVRKVKAAQFVASHPGEVCPAKWNEGAETLKPSIDLVGKI